MPYLNLIEAIEFSNVKIASNLSSIVYIVKFPLTSKESCKLIKVKAVKQGHKAIKLEYENLIICNKEIFGVRDSFKNINNLILCKQSSIKEVTLNTCIPNLLKGHSSNCTLINSHHMPTIEEIMPGLLFINSYDGPLKTDNKEINLNGTFLIRYDNSSLSIEGKHFVNKNQLFAKPLPAIAKSTNATTNLEEVLSLQYLKELNIANIQKIDDVNLKYKISIFTCSSIIMLSLIILLATMIAKKLNSRKKMKINIQVNTSSSKETPTVPTNEMPSNEDAAYFKGGGVNGTYSEIGLQNCPRINT